MGRKRKKVGGGGVDDGGNEARRTRNVVGAEVEENTLAILDMHESRHQRAQYTHDDRIAFLEAVRNAAVVAKNGRPPTDKMFYAIFEILRTGMFMDSMTASYQLLCELETRFPRVSFSTGQVPHSSLSSSMECDFEPLKEAWSPFSFASEGITGERMAFKDGSSASFDPSGFHELIQGLAKIVNEAKTMGLESLRNLLVFQYLAKVLQGDFLSRKNVPKETKDWIILRESLLNMILSSRKLNCKDLIKDCLSLICGMGQFLAGLGTDDSNLKLSTTNSSEDCSHVITIPLLEAGENASLAMQKLLIMMMELDSLRKHSDMKGFTTRADVVRSPTADIMLDELTYNVDILSPFFQAFDQPQWKIDIILQYFAKYMPKPSVRTRKGNNSNDDATFNLVLKTLSNLSSLKSVTKKIGSNTIQLLLAHAFMAHLSLSCKPDLDEVCLESTKDEKVLSLIEVSRGMISAFESLKKIGYLEIIPVGKEALFAASTIIRCSSQ